MFCGCGGLSLGFQNAGFEIVAGLDHWDSAIACYKRNFSHEVEDVDLFDVEKSVEIISKYKPDVIVGGPPCQDFSMAGNRIEGNRANLTVSFANIVKEIAPQFFIMENVERAANSEAYKKARIIFKEAGYGLTEKVLDASFCGVPQRRKRFFCIGSKHEKDGFLDGLLSTNQSIFPLTIREYFEQEELELNIDYYYRHPRSYSRRAIFSVDEPSPTIRGVNRPKPMTYKRHKGDAEDPANLRNLTFRERSIIQTFPLEYIWEDTVASIEQMIGNAVPVKLAEYVASCLKRFIEGDVDTHNLGFIDWLKHEKHLSLAVAGDTLSRIGRARRILNFDNMDCETYLNLLNSNELFENIVPSVRAQIRRAVRLYYEYTF